MQWPTHMSEENFVQSGLSFYHFWVSRIDQGLEKKMVDRSSNSICFLPIYCSKESHKETLLQEEI